MSEISIQAATGAAQDLVRLLNNNPNTPPQSHSVWVNTGVGPDGEFVRCINVSVHPKWKGKISIPQEHAGVPVQEVAWPKVQG